MATGASLGVWLEKWSRFEPERTALVDGETGARWTYAEFHRRAMHRAAWLRDKHKVGPGDRVAWTDQNRMEFFEVFFACARLGAILVPVNWRLAQPEIDWILGNCEPKVVLNGESIAALPEGPAPAVPCAPIRDDTPVMILYTSGTTGRPKGALLTHGSITANSVNTQVACDLRSDDSTVTYTPLFHTGAVNVLSVPLFHRAGKVVLLGGFDAGKILEVVEQESITILFGVPTTFEMMRDDERFKATNFATVRFALCGGAPCPKGLIHDYAEVDVVFRQGYGLTEVGPNCFSLMPRDAVRKAGTVGFPVMHCEARIVDADGGDVKPGEVGELWLTGPHVCGGYWNNPEATRAALKDGWWATGDLFEQDDDGYFKVVGRKKEMFISGGENVYPAEVEQALVAHPEVRESTVVGVPDEKWGEVGCAYVAPAGIEGAALKSFLNERIARYKIPKHFVAVDELPRTATGKVDRRGIAALGESLIKTLNAGASAMLLLFLLLAGTITPAFAAPTISEAKVLGGDKEHTAAVLAIASFGTKAVTGDRKGQALLWDVEAGEVVAAFPRAGGPVLAVAMSGTVVAIGSGDGEVRLFDTSLVPKLKEGQDRRVFALSKSQPKVKDWAKGGKPWDAPGATALAFDAKGENLCAGYADGALREWAVKTGKEQRHVTKHHTARVSGLVYAPIRRKEVLVSSSWDGTVKIIKRGKRAWKTVKVCKPELTGVAVTDDGEVSTCAHTGELYAISLKTAKVLRRTDNEQGWLGNPSKSGPVVAAPAPNENAVAFFDDEGHFLVHRKIGTNDIREKRVVLVVSGMTGRVLAGCTDGTVCILEISEEGT